MKIFTILLLVIIFSGYSWAFEPRNYTTEFSGLISDYSESEQATILSWLDSVRRNSPEFFDFETGQQKSIIDKYLENKKYTATPESLERVNIENELKPQYNMSRKLSLSEFNKQHLGKTNFDQGYGLLIKITKPEGFDLKFKSERPLLGNDFDETTLNKISEDRDLVYKLLADHLPEEQIFRVQDLYQVENGDLIVHVEIDDSGVDPQEFMSLSIINRVYRFYNFDDSIKNTPLETSSLGRFAKVEHLGMNWEKDTSYSTLKSALDNKVFTYVAIQFELSPEGNDSESSVRERLYNRINDTGQYKLHPRQQFSYGTNVPVLDGLTNNPLLRKVFATREMLEVLYEFEDVINIVPSY